MRHVFVETNWVYAYAAPAHHKRLDAVELLEVRTELRQLDDIIASLRNAPGLELFPLSEKMLERAVAISALDLSLRPFDHAILAAVLVRADELSVFDRQLTS